MLNSVRNDGAASWTPLATNPLLIAFLAQHIVLARFENKIRLVRLADDAIALESTTRRLTQGYERVVVHGRGNIE